MNVISSHARRCVGSVEGVGLTELKEPNREAKRPCVVVISAALHDLRDFSSPTRDRTWGPGSNSAES